MNIKSSDAHDLTKQARSNSRPLTLPTVMKILNFLNSFVTRELCVKEKFCFHFGSEHEIMPIDKLKTPPWQNYVLNSVTCSEALEVYEYERNVSWGWNAPSVFRQTKQIDNKWNIPWQNINILLNNNTRYRYIPCRFLFQNEDAQIMRQKWSANMIPLTVRTPGKSVKRGRDGMGDICMTKPLIYN
jgi:hypothetical protein